MRKTTQKLPQPKTESIIRLVAWPLDPAARFIQAVVAVLLRLPAARLKPMELTATVSVAATVPPMQAAVQQLILPAVP